MASAKFKQKRIVITLTTASLCLVVPVALANNLTSGWDKVKGVTQQVDKASQQLVNNVAVALNGGTSEELAALNEQAKKEAASCAAGAEGTQGKAIKDAVDIHTTFASVGPDVEKFFNQNHDCFAKLNKLYDLSFSIPSLSSILNAAQEAVVDYAKQKACSAVREATEELVAPINSAIDKVNNNFSSYLDLNGMANGAITSGLSKLDTSLGQTYANKAPTAGYEIQMFSQAQTTFNNSPLTGGNGNGSTTTQGGYTYNNQHNQLSNLNTALQQEQIKLPQAQQNLNTARQRLNNCQAQQGNCAQFEQQVNQAQAELNRIQSSISSYQSRVSTLAGNGNAVTAGELRQNSSGLLPNNQQQIPAQQQAQLAPNSNSASGAGSNKSGSSRYSDWLKQQYSR